VVQSQHVAARGGAAAACGGAAAAKGGSRFETRPTLRFFKHANLRNIRPQDDQ